MMMMMKMIFFGAIGGMNLAGETEVLRGNLPRTAAVGSQRLTA
jgi:hypothetical protein